MIDIFQAYSIEEVMRTAIALIILVGAIISIGFVVWWGFLMILSAGNEEKVKSAVNHIRHAFLWVLFLVAALFVFPIFLDLLSVEYGDYLRPRSVFAQIWMLSDRLLWSSSSDTFDNWETWLPPDFSDF